MRDENEEKGKRHKAGRPVENPNSPIHEYWKELKRREKARRKGDPVPDLDEPLINKYLNKGARAHEPT